MDYLWKIDSFLRQSIKSFRFAKLIRILLKTVKLAIILAIFYVTVIFVYTTARFFYNRNEIIDTINEKRDILHEVKNKETTLPPPNISIYAADHSLIGEFLPIRGSQITMNSCKSMKWLKLAAVSSEDRHFYEHGGVSFRGIARAMVNNLTSFSIREGGGSITQQLGRNLFTQREYSLSRKVYETYIAYQLESLLSKDEILCLYLNEIYMGEGRSGAEEAAWFYFRKPPEQLTDAEAAMIVGLFPSPVRYSPLNNIKLSLRKQEIVLNTLIRDEHLTKDAVKKDVKKFIKQYEIQPEGENPHAGLVGAYGASRDFRLNLAPAANEGVKEFLYENIPEEFILKGGLKVYTTIDPARQESAVKAVREVIIDTRNQMGRNVNISYKELQRIRSRLNGVLISIDPYSGDILAMVGGYRVEEGGSMSNRIWNMRRQPGSVLKGFLYAAAMNEHLLNVDSEVVDEPINYSGYKPRNWYNGYKGEISLRTAIAMSVNTVAVKTLKELGTGKFIDYTANALELGYFEARNRFTGSLSLALGSGELTPMELARLYAPLLNGGMSIKPKLVISVENDAGTLLWEAEKSYSPARIFDTEICAGVLDLLTSVVDENDNGTAGWIGIAKQKNPDYLPFPIAGKSGTVQSVPAVIKKFHGMQGVHDAWFAGLVPGEVTIVWVGQDDGAPFVGGGSQTGGRVWALYAQDALTGKVTGEFPEYLKAKGILKVDSSFPGGVTKPEELNIHDPKHLSDYEKDMIESKGAGGGSTPPPSEPMFKQDEENPIQYENGLSTPSSLDRLQEPKHGQTDKVESYMR